MCLWNVFAWLFYLVWFVGFAKRKGILVMKDFVWNVFKSAIGIGLLLGLDYSIFLNYNYVIRDIFQMLPTITYFQTVIVTFVFGLIFMNSVTAFKYESRTESEKWSIIIVRMVFLFATFGLYWFVNH